MRGGKLPESPLGETSRMNMEMQKYFKCGSCGLIELESECKDSHSQLICCHCNGTKRNNWPSIDVSELLGFILSYDKSQPRYSQVVSIFLSSTLELLLEELLLMILYWDLLYEEVCFLVEALLDSHQGRGRMLELYKRIGHCSFAEESKQLGYKDYFRNWEILISTRNKIVHGKMKEAPVINSDFVEKMIRDSLEVFRLLHNEYYIETSAYKWSMRTPEEKAKDDELFSKL